MASLSKKPATEVRKKNTSSSFLKGGKVWFVMAIIAAVLAAGGSFFVLNSVASTTTYYVLNQDVPARTQIDESMLAPVVTSLGGQPRNALDIGYVQTNPTYSKFALRTGDVLSSSNAGALTTITAGVPDNFVVASFSAPPENAVAGRVKRGDYVDIVTVTQDPASGDNISKFVLRKVLVLDVNSALAAAPVDEATAGGDAAAADTSASRSGVPALYTVALSPEDAATLAVISDDKIFLVLSSIEDVTNGAGEKNIGQNKSGVYSDPTVGDSGVGTDATFGEDKTDETATEETVTEESEAPATEETGTTTEETVTE